MTSPTPSAPLVILGIDAGDYDLLLGWARGGHLPNLARFLAEGAYGRTGGRDLDIEHGAWMAVLSGRSKRQHGYHYYRQLIPGTYDLRLVTGADVDAKPFWAHLGDGRRAAIIDVPDSLPMPNLPGVQIHNYAIHNPQDRPQTIPPALLGQIESRFGKSERIDEHIRSGVEDDRRIYHRLMARVKRKGELIRNVLAADAYDVAVAVFAESHTGGHQLWEYRPEARQPKADDPLLRDGIRDLYAAVDREIGLIVEQLPEEATVILVSSVGLIDQYPMGGMIAAFCRKLGYQASPEKGPAKASLRPIDLARKLMPQWLLGMASRMLFNREKRERMLADAFRTGTDWSKTTAFATPSAYASYIRVNLRGREPRGIVEPADYDSLLDRIENDLRQLIDPVTNDCPVDRIDRAAVAFGPDPSPHLPDLIVHWKPADHFRDRLIHPKGELTQTQPEFFRSSDHSRHGFIALRGKSVAPRGELGDIEVLDLAPTFLTMLGCDPADSMAGRCRSDWISPGAAAAVVDYR